LLTSEELASAVGGAAAPSAVADALAANPDDAAACMQGAFKSGFDAARGNLNATLNLDAVFPGHVGEIPGQVAAGAAAGDCLARIRALRTPASSSAD